MRHPSMMECAVWGWGGGFPLDLLDCLSSYNLLTIFIMVFFSQFQKDFIYVALAAPWLFLEEMKLLIYSWVVFVQKIHCIESFISAISSGWWEKNSINTIINRMFLAGWLESLLVWRTVSTSLYSANVSTVSRCKASLPAAVIKTWFCGFVFLPGQYFVCCGAVRPAGWYYTKISAAVKDIHIRTR